MYVFAYLIAGVPSDSSVETTMMVSAQDLDWRIKLGVLYFFLIQPTHHLESVLCSIDANAGLTKAVMTVGVRCSVLTFDPRIFVVGQSTFYKGTLVPQRNIIFQNNFCMDSLVYSFYSIFCVRSLLTKNG